MALIPAAALAIGDQGDLVHKAPTDDREYGLVELDNGVRGLVISDPDTDMAAAAMHVRVGHYADPRDREGLAHFLEHMLFLGTDQYPDADDYRVFVKSNGGQLNAGTSGESTTYYFQVSHEALEGAFDRFSRHFVAPTLDPAYVDRERNAVHSEYTLKVRDEARRTRQVLKSTTNPEHPESKFSVGNLDTLGDRDGEPVYKALEELYRREYRPDRMTFAVLGRQSVDELSELVRDRLEAIPRRGRRPEADRPLPFRPDQLGVRVDMEPLKEQREIQLRFPVPSQREQWPVRPYDYISRILGHEGEGTLFASLKAAGWIEALSAGLQGGAEDYDEFTIVLRLTEGGAAHVDELVSACFAGVRQIAARGVEPFRVEEERTLRELAFRFAEPQRPSHAVRSAARDLYLYGPEHVLDHGAIVGDLSDGDLVRALARLVPENMRLIVTMPGVQTDRVEPLYDVPYRVRDLTPQEIARFRSDPVLGFAPFGENRYLPQRTDLVAGAPDAVPRQLPAPPGIELWHLADTSFRVPRAFGHLWVWAPAGRRDDRARVLTSLYARLLADALQEFRYPLSEAGLGFSTRADDRGLQVRFWGYDEPQARMLDEIGQRIASFEVDPERFEIVRARALRDWKNIAQERPITQVMYALGESLDPFALSASRALEIGPTLTADDLAAFARDVLDRPTARMLVHGNHPPEAARALAASVAGALVPEGGASGVPVDAARLVPAGREVVRDVEVDHVDSALVVYYLGGGDAVGAAAHAKWQLLGRLLDAPFHTEIRTEQQLGYIAQAAYSPFGRLPGLRMAIQSNAVGPVTLLERVDAFVDAQRAALRAMPDDALATVRDGLVARLLEDDPDLYSRSSRLAANLDREVLSFDWRAQVAEAVAALDRDALLDFYDQVLASEQTGRLVVRSFGTAHAAERAAAEPGCPDLACVSEQLIPWPSGT